MFGSTMSLPKEDVLNHRRKEMLDLIAVMMAGRISEEIVSGDISSGASGDIQQATSVARAMVCQWGMSDKMGMVQYGNDQEQVYMGRDMAQRKDYSEFTAQEIDAEVKRIIQSLGEQGKTVLFNSHILSDVSELCSRIAIMREGRVLWQGAVDEAKPTHGATLEDFFMEVVTQ